MKQSDEIRDIYFTETDVNGGQFRPHTHANIFVPDFDLPEIGRWEEVESAAELVRAYVAEVNEKDPVPPEPTDVQYAFMTGFTMHVRRQAIISVRETIQMCIV